MKKFPNKLRNLTLIIIGNCIIENADNLKCFKEGIKLLPKDLNNFELDLK